MLTVLGLGNHDVEADLVHVPSIIWNRVISTTVSKGCTLVDVHLSIVLSYLPDCIQGSGFLPVRNDVFVFTCFWNALG